jgi:transcription elongation GreA/GreB family factor
MINQSNIKKELYEHCQHYVQDLLKRAQQGITTSQQAAAHEQKSSAGDKFETHRAMMHLQTESFVRRLEVAQALADELIHVSSLPRTHIGLGSLVETEQGWYFIAISAPSHQIDQHNYTMLSTQAPFYQAMQGLEAGDWVEWTPPQGQSDLIEIIQVF